jgi:hypothetical protein
MKRRTGITGGVVVTLCANAPDHRFDGTIESSIHLESGTHWHLSLTWRTPLWVDG